VVASTISAGALSAKHVVGEKQVLSVPSIIEG